MGPTAQASDGRDAGRERASIRNLTAVLRKIPAVAYQYVWPYLPRRRRWLTFNDVIYPQRERLTDPWMPDVLTKYVPQDAPEYEVQYVAAIREAVLPGDDVVLVGGGKGVSTVVAARETGPRGTVTTFEAAASSVSRVRETAALNGVEERVTVRHAIVSEAVNPRNAVGDAAVVAPEDLPVGDAILIDCDGPELDILHGMVQRPRTLVVEHHAVPGDEGLDIEYTPERVADQLVDMGYEIVSRREHPTRAFGMPELVLVASTLETPTER
jgi:precorrin-6B methylase 2